MNEPGKFSCVCPEGYQLLGTRLCQGSGDISFVGAAHCRVVSHAEIILIISDALAKRT